MIVSFNDKASEDIFNGIGSRVARKACPQDALARNGKKVGST